MHRRFLISLGMLVMLTSACQINLTQTTVVNEDGSGTVVLDVLLDEELRTLTGFEDASSALELAGGSPEGFVVEDIEDGDFKGARATQTFANLDELNEILSQAAGTGVVDDVSFVKEGNEFRFEATVGDLAEAANSAGLAGLSDDTFDDLFQIELVVQLPGELIEHNADTVSAEGVLTWDVNIADSGQDLNATTRVAVAWAPLAIGGILGVMVLVGGGYAVSRRRRTAPEEPPLSEQTEE